MKEAHDFFNQIKELNFTVGESFFYTFQKWLIPLKFQQIQIMQALKKYSYENYAEIEFLILKTRREDNKEDQHFSDVISFELIISKGIFKGVLNLPEVQQYKFLSREIALSVFEEYEIDSLREYERLVN